MPLTIKWMSKFSWFIIKSNGKTIHIDPGYSGYFSNQGIQENELEKADIVLVTHFHKDHLQPFILSKIRNTNTIVLSPECCLERIGGDVKVIKSGEKVSLGNINVTVVDAYNTENGNSTRKIHHKGEGVGFIIEVDGKTLYHSGDTDLIPEMRNFGKIDIALIPIGGKFTMDIDEAIKSIMLIKPKVVIPMHYLNADPEDFKKKTESKIDCNVIILKKGESHILM